MIPRNQRLWPAALLLIAALTVIASCGGYAGDTKPIRPKWTPASVAILPYSEILPKSQNAAVAVSPLTYAVARGLVTVDMIGMANIVLERKAFPEFLQGGLRSEPLAETVSQLLDPDSAMVTKQRESFEELHRRLGRGAGAGANVARMAGEILDATPA